MAILVQAKTHASHWYSTDGRAVHTVKRAKATPDGIWDRPTTLSDAKKEGLFPSVSGILDIFAKPQLEQWKFNQIVLAALRIQKQEQESADYYAKRVIDGAFEQVEQAADLGSQVHKSLDMVIEDGTMDRCDPAVYEYIKPVLGWFAERNLTIEHREKIVVNHQDGFAGTLDMGGKFLLGADEFWFLLDYKTRKTKPGVKVEPYDYQPWQIAAYAKTLYPEQFRFARVYGVNLFVSTTEVGRIEHVRYSPEELIECYNCFRCATTIWRKLKGYDPRKSLPIETTTPAMDVPETPPQPAPSVSPAPSNAVPPRPSPAEPTPLPKVGKKAWVAINTNNVNCPWMKTTAEYVKFMGVVMALHRPIDLLKQKLVKASWTLTDPVTGRNIEALKKIKSNGKEQWLDLAESFLADVSNVKDLGKMLDRQRQGIAIAPDVASITIEIP